MQDLQPGIVRARGSDSVMMKPAMTSAPSIPAEQHEHMSPDIVTNENVDLNETNADMLSLPTILDSEDVFCKLILSNILAGSLIGKNGATISSIRTKSGANIRISNVINAYSPDRLALISGVRDAIAIALDQVVELGSQSFGESSLENGLMMKIVIPKTSVSLLIGKGGQRINEMRRLTNCRIHVSTKEETSIPSQERIVKILGSEPRGVSAALLLIILAIQADPVVKESHSFGSDTSATMMMGGHNSPMRHNRYMGNMSPYPGPTNNMPFPMHNQSVDYGRQFGMDNWMMERNCEIFMQVPDAFVGALVGKSGQHITEIKQSSSAKVEISKKGDFVEGTTDRLVTISGSIMSCHAAHARLMKRIMELQQADPALGRGYHAKLEHEHNEYYGYN